MKKFTINKDNIFLKSAISIGKILILTILAYLSINIFFVKNNIQLAIGFFIIIFIALPTVFLFFFKDKFLAKHPKFNIFWKIIRVIYIISVVLYIVGYLLGAWHLNSIERVQKSVDFINSKKITLNDVMGTNLPPKPDQNLNDSTIAGIDANGNFIRDDVELAIFEKYPDSAKIRAAELQYAQALQLELTQVYNSETYVAAMQKEDLAFYCLGFSGPDTSLSAAEVKEKEINTITINTDSRHGKQSVNFKDYMIGYASSNENECNLELSSLPN